MRGPANSFKVRRATNHYFSGSTRLNRDLLTRGASRRLYVEKQGGGSEVPSKGKVKRVSTHLEMGKGKRSISQRTEAMRIPAVDGDGQE